MEENKSKSIIIDGVLHHKLKVFCRGKNMKIGGVVEELVKLYLYNPKQVHEMIENYNDKK
jgi:hypothetical protein